MTTEQSGEAIARVYDRQGNHVADLHSSDLVHELESSAWYDVQMIKKVTA